MGRQVAEACRQAGLPVRAGIDLKAENAFPFPVYSSFAELPPCPEDVVIDFSLPGSLDEMCGSLERDLLQLVGEKE